MAPIGGNKVARATPNRRTAHDANGVNRNGKAYDIKITKPLIKRFGCSYIESGIVELTPEGLSTRTIDYGDGTCDNKAKLTINGNSFDFTLK